MTREKSRADVVKLMEGCFGQQKADLLIEAAARETGLADRQAFSIEDVDAMLRHLSRAPGLIGISARFAQSRLHVVWDGDGAF